MSGPRDTKPKKPRRLLSEEDEAVWNYVARSIEPAKGKPRVNEVEPDADLLAAFTARAGSKPTPQARPSPPPPPARSPQPPPRKPSPPEPQAVPLERRKARRIARGTDEIDARLDLHGMTQEDAHHALSGFIRRCHAAGHRTVLVITGKGATGRDDGDVVPRPRGVLRRNVPRWLASPDIGPLVISYTTAHIRHGGEGALYVRLRRKG